MTIVPVIQELSKEEARMLAKRIRPVQMFPNSGRCYVRRVDPFADFMENPRIESQATDIEPFAMLTTFHRPRRSGVFLATIAEVLAQIPRSPEEILHRTVAFEILRKPRTQIDPKIEREAFRAGYYVAKTRLFQQIT